MKKTTIYLLAILALTLTGCNFLDKNPDMRATIDTKEKVQLLLVSAYTRANSGAICEFASDQVIDNNAPNATGHSYALNALDKMYDEIFAWEDIKSDGQQDSPKYIWDACYTAIATCNQALKAIEELEKQGINMDAEKGEALISRAYHHFVLANVFCHAWKDDERSKQDLGITYITEPETTVAPQYERGTLYDTYKAIEKDLMEGLPLVDDSYYSVPKYHFNTKAAYAFAARFYLYKRDYDKVIQCANQVLTTDKNATLAMLYPAQKARELGDPTQEQKLWIDPTGSWNLLIYTTMSQAPYTIIPDYGRYQHNGEASDYSTLGDGPCWKKMWNGFPLWLYNQEYGCFCAKFLYLFEYTDKVNGYGFIHGVTRAFTTNETLLCRAEAKVFKNDFAGATEDLRLWMQGYKWNSRIDTLENGNVNLSEAKIKSFFKPTANKHYVPDLHNADMSPRFQVTEDQKPFIYCVLLLRRIETLHDGLRWHDIKRYGIEITHKRGTEPVRTLVWNDDRRAFQLPQDVRMAGMTPNPRVIVGDNVSGVSTATMPVDDGQDIKLPFINFADGITKLEDKE